MDPNSTVSIKLGFDAALDMESYCKTLIEQPNGGRVPEFYLLQHSAFAVKDRILTLLSHPNGCCIKLFLQDHRPAEIGYVDVLPSDYLRLRVQMSLDILRDGSSRFSQKSRLFVYLLPGQVGVRAWLAPGKLYIGSYYGTAQMQGPQRDNKSAAHTLHGHNTVTFWCASGFPDFGRLRDFILDVPASMFEKSELAVQELRPELMVVGKTIVEETDSRFDDGIIRISNRPVDGYSETAMKWLEALSQCDSKAADNVELSGQVVAEKAFGRTLRFNDIRREADIVYLRDKVQAFRSSPRGFRITQVGRDIARQYRRSLL